MKGDVLEISLSQASNRGQTQIPLRRISTEYDRFARRVPILYLPYFALCVPCCILVWLILRQNVVPHETIFSPCLGVLFFLMLAIRGLFKVEFFQFYDHWKRPIFFVIREGKQSSECDDFVQTLLERLEQIENDQPLIDVEEKFAPPIGISLPSPDEVSALGYGENRWKAAIIFGVISAGLSWPNAVVLLIGDFQTLIVLGAAIAGAAFSVFSFIAKERFR